MVEKLLPKVEDIYFKRGYARLSLQPNAAFLIGASIPVS